MSRNNIKKVIKILDIVQTVLFLRSFMSIAELLLTMCLKQKRKRRGLFDFSRY